MRPEEFHRRDLKSRKYSKRMGSSWGNSFVLNAVPVKERGLMLFVVAIVLVILCLGGTTMLLYMRTESDAASVRTLELQLENTSRSAVACMRGVLELSPSQRANAGGLYNNPKLFAFQPVLTQSEGARDEIRFTILAPEFRADAIEGVRYGLVNESTRLNLAAVLRWEHETPGLGRETLMKLPGMTASQADSILDWIDADAMPRPNGAENAWYAEKGLPYSTRGTVPVFLEELLLVRDVTRLQLYADDEKMNFGNVASDSAGKSEAMTPGVSVSSAPIPWSYLLTVFSVEKDIDPRGLARIDLNGNDLEFLHAELVQCLERRLADFIVLARQYGTKANATGRDAFPDGSPDADIDFTVPGRFKFASPLDLAGLRIAVPASIFASDADNTPPARKKIISSPITDGSSRALLFKLLDYTSTGPDTTIVGRININESPRAVLRCIPRLNAAQIDRIIAMRPSPQSENADDYRHAAWLYTEGIVDLPTMKFLFDKVTVGGDVFRSQIIAFAPGRGAFCRAQAVVDASVSPPRQVFYKNLTSCGIGFSSDVLQGKKEW
ncbi:MAG: type II secretion system protein GspK [Thermoguttaceae bacterium]|nr:type II secretion system protein GspK [Thermoguttaceae bacterium]